LVGADALDGADGALQDVVAASELAGLLHRDQVAGFLDHADHGGVTAVVVADAAQGTLGEVEAASAPGHPILGLTDGAGQTHRVVLRKLQEVQSDALRRLWSHAGKSSQLIDEVLDRTRVDSGHLDRSASEEVVEADS